MLTELSIAGGIAILVIVGLLATGMALFHDFPWDALATLLAGAGAVVAAIIIGKRQTSIAAQQNGILDRQAGIADRQTDMIAQQVEVQKLALRSDLYDRRFKVFEVTSEYLRSVYNGEEIMGTELSIKWKQARDQARFLFDVELSNALEGMHKAAYSYYGIQRLYNSRMRSGQEVAAGDVNAVTDAQNRLGLAYGNLDDVFGPHLTVSDKPFVKRSHDIAETPNGDPA